MFCLSKLTSLNNSWFIVHSLCRGIRAFGSPPEVLSTRTQLVWKTDTMVEDSGLDKDENEPPYAGSGTNSRKLSTT